jgi:hypothetical protein
MDISIAARPVRALISVNRGRCGAGYSQQGRKRGNAQNGEMAGSVFQQSGDRFASRKRVKTRI